MTLDIATLRAAGRAATKGPWHRGQRIISAGIEPSGMEGTGKCALCHPSRPLHSVVPRGYHSEYGGKISDLHRHIDPEPHRVDHVIQSEDGELVAGNYDYEDGGIVNPHDAAFIALARNHWDELLDEIERRNVGLRNAGELIASQAAEIEGYWEIIENNIPGYGEPANYVKRIERAGRDARLANKHRDERDALKECLHNASSVCMRAHELLIRYENKTLRPEVGTGECIDDLTALLASLEEGVSRG